MIRWIPYTFVRISVFFIGGILLAIFFPLSIPSWFALVVVLTSVTIYTVLFFLRLRVSVPAIAMGLVSFVAIFFGGYLHVHHKTNSEDPLHFGSVKEIQQYVVTISGYPEEKEKSWKVTGDVSFINTLNSWQPAFGKVLLYFRKSDFSKPFAYGDKLVINGSMQVVPAPGNPGEFNYKQFLSYRNVYHQHFITLKDALFIENDPPNFLIANAIRTRAWANGILHQYVSGPRQQAIASALILGVTDGLDNELLATYASTGTMHVLAVSGLHITIIYLIILWLLKPLNKSRRGKWLVALVSLLVLWGYAFVTGLSPSVLRAVTMFTFICVAKATSRSTNIYNTLAASAFCLLLYDPYLIMSVGFQLSYLAVLGIVYLYPFLYSWWEPRQWLTEKIWSTICVSVAAQLATFPLGLLYFHQFPNYFLLSNLLVIPLSFGVLVLGLLLLTVGAINVVASGVGMLLTWCIQAMNFSVEFVELLPYSLIENIYISPQQSIVLMLGCLFIIFTIQFKRYRYFVMGFVCMVSFALLQWQYHFQRIDQSKILVYKVAGHTAIDFIDGESTYFLADSLLQKDTEKIRYHIKPNRLISHVNNVHDIHSGFAQSIQGGKLIIWKGKQILYISEKNFSWHGNLAPAIVIIANNAINDLSSFSLDANTPIIFDSSNSFYYIKKMLDENPSLRNQAHSILHDGAFEILPDFNS